MCWNKTRYQSLLKSFAIPETVLSPASTVFLSKVPAAPSSIGSSSGQFTRKFTPTPIEKLSHKQARRGYEPSAIRTRFGDDVQFIIVRPDFFAFAAAKDFGELRQCLVDLTSLLS
jgi:hypothetical protein